MSHLLKNYIFIIAIIALSPLRLIASTEVKLSKTGICHTTTSPSYNQTKRYTSFNSLEDCIAAGGRVAGSPKQQVTHQTASKALSKKKYIRTLFGQGWLDFDGDCRDSRAEALISMSTIPVRFAKGGCRVVAGRWISPFTGNVIMNASDIDIDHLAALKWAWDRGADDWTQEKRESFANDPVNLWPVEAHLNREKGAKGPNEWLPPKGQCQYVARVRRVTIMYGLNLTDDELAWFKSFLSQC